MSVLSILLFALSSNMDNFIIGTSYGIKKIQINFAANLVIGVITCVGTVLSMLAGRGLLGFVPEAAAKLLGSTVLLIIGGACLAKYLYQKIKPPGGPSSAADGLEKYDKDKSKRIELRESLALGCALSINNIGLGVSASMAGLNIAAASAASLICSLLFIYAGNLFGNGCISKFFGKYAEPLASVIIILLGVFAMIN